MLVAVNVSKTAGWVAMSVSNSVDPEFYRIWFWVHTVGSGLSIHGVANMALILEVSSK